METSAPPLFLLHHSNTSSSDVYAMKSLAFSVLPLLKCEVGYTHKLLPQPSTLWNDYIVAAKYLLLLKLILDVYYVALNFYKVSCMLLH